MGLMTKLFGTYSDRELKAIYPIVDKVEALEEEYRALTDAQLRAKTEEFKERYAQGESLDDLLPEAFATVREAADRVLGLRPYRVQLVGGVVLHQGRIAEMKTGEGKTLVATLPAYLNALTGKGVHIVTVNDYLAKRDSEWMGKVHRFLGLKVGLIIHGLNTKERQEAYAADITYGTNNEMGFDYLRDNMCIYSSELVQRGHAFAIVDEVDSILIDEARTPLIISGQGEKSTQLYDMAEMLVARMRKRVVAEVDAKEEESETEEAVHLAHPLAVALGKIVVHRDDVHAVSGERVEVSGESGDERFALAGLHLGDAPLMEHDAADELHAVGIKPEHAARGLAHGGKGLGQNVVERFTVGEPRLEFRRLGAQLLVRQGAVLVRHRLDLIDDRINALEFPLGVGAEELGDQSHIKNFLSRKIEILLQKSIKILL